HRGGGIFERPTQSEDISRETARGVAAPALEHLHEPWQVDAGGGAEQHVDVGPENGQRHDVSVFSRSGSAKVLDRKSTRMNSSHGSSSYAVFCLKKKKNTSSRTNKTTE